MNNITNPRYTELFTLVNNTTNNTSAKVQELLDSTFGNKYVVRFFNNTRLCIGVQCGYWNNGEPRFQDLDIYHGYDFHYSFAKEMKATKVFKFESNIGAMGNFSLIDNTDSREYKYYMLVANVMGNIEFKHSLYEILHNMADAIEPLTNEMEEIRTKFYEDEQARIKAENEKKHQEELDKAAEEFKNTSAEFAIILKDNGGNFIYRKAEVQVVEFGNHYGQLLYKTRELIRSNYKKYALVEVKKLRLAA